VNHATSVIRADVTQGSWKKYLNESDDRYDVIIALDVFEHLPTHEIASTLEITCKRLSPAGRLILRAPNALCPFVLPTFYGDLTHQFLSTPRMIDHLARLAGFRGPIRFAETRPSGRIQCALYRVLHYLLFKPLIGLAYFHFHGEFPSAITVNLIACIEKEGRQHPE
jgi:hypothetical protein